MRLLVATDVRYVQTPDGGVWTQSGFNAQFWERYLETFSSVRVIARMEKRDVLDGNFWRADTAAIEFSALPSYRGPWQYVKVRKTILHTIRNSVQSADRFLAWVPSRLGTDLVAVLWEAGLPYGLEVLGDPQEAFAPGAIRHPLRPVLRYLVTRDLRRQCARAAVVNYVTADRLQRRYPAHSHERTFAVSDVKLGPESFVPQPREDRTNLGRMEGACRSNGSVADEYLSLVFVGTLEQMYKAPDVLLRAVRLLVDRGCEVKLSILGEGRHRLELEQYCVSLGIEKNVQFLGQVPAGEAVRGQFDSADLMVMPSLTEGLPKALLEAMARAVPCVATNVGGIPELLDPEYLVPPGDSKALADKILEVTRQPSRLALMSKRNLAKAQEYRAELLHSRRTAFYKKLQEASIPA